MALLSCSGSLPVCVAAVTSGSGCRTMALVVLFNIVLGEMQVPLPSWSPSRGFSVAKYPVFKFFSVSTG